MIITDLAISILIGVAMVLLVQARFTSISHDPSETAFMISEQLVASRGVPEDWTNETLLTPGLAKTRGDLDPAKISELSKLTPETLRQVFNSRYDITITLDDTALVDAAPSRDRHRFFRHVTVDGEPHVLGVILSEG